MSELLPDAELEMIRDSWWVEECPRCLGRLRMFPLDPAAKSLSDHKTPICRVCKLDEWMRWSDKYHVATAAEWPFINGQGHEFIRSAIQTHNLNREQHDGN